MFKVLAKIFGSSNERTLAKYTKLLPEIAKFYEEFKAFKEEEFEVQTNKFREMIKNGATLDAILPQAFALVQAASEKVLGMKHFDVQLIGGMVLHEGKVAEMSTGEGKTLTAALPSYLNALTGNPVHIVTVNDYLVKRDGIAMQPLFDLLGMKCDWITSEIDPNSRSEKYESDVLYITNNELGFDYLRDNMRRSKQECTLTKHGLSFAIVDEIDSILIDESRTPLIISGPVEQSGDIYTLSKDIVRTFTEEDFEIEEKHKSVYITDTGYQKIDAFLQKVGILKPEESLYAGHDFHTQARNNHIMHGVTQALKAIKTMKDNVDYILRNGEILIVDEFTGRIMEGRRYSDGLHQAIEAKHGVAIQQETQTLASITYQNYFRMYEKLSGMTGTASTEAHEFHEIYNLSVVSIPTHRNLQRIDEGDKIYRTEDEKFQAILELVKEVHEKGQPVLIGTASVGKSEKLAALFTKNKLEHNVLNAKNHEQEAQIIADAGKFGAITIATNMAGRGTDIILGGSLEKKIIKASRYIQDINEKQKIIEEAREEHNHQSEKVKNVGGLFVIGSERHESRRIDNQLRGRCGRQGDVGRSQFFLSLEDDLLRIFGGDKLKSLLGTLGFKEGESIEHPWLNSVISRSQSKIEAHHFEIRKNLIKYDDIMNTQRKIVYKKRMELIDDTQSVANLINAMFVSFIEKSVKPSLANPIVEEIFEELKEFEGTLLEKLQAMWVTKYHDESLQGRARHTAIAILDSMWKEHLYNVDSLKSNMHLRSYAQKDPLSEYKIEVFEAFEQMTANYNAYLIKELIS